MTVTVPDETRPVGLSDSKLIAIDTLVTGATHREAADAAGVARTTVTEWVNHRGEFRSDQSRHSVHSLMSRPNLEILLLPAAALPLRGSPRRLGFNVCFGLAK